jgi:hypothetical protein
MDPSHHHCCGSATQADYRSVGGRTGYRMYLRSQQMDSRPSRSSPKSDDHFQFYFVPLGWREESSSQLETGITFSIFNRMRYPKRPFGGGGQLSWPSQCPFCPVRFDPTGTGHQRVFKAPLRQKRVPPCYSYMDPEVRGNLNRDRPSHPRCWKREQITQKIANSAHFPS